MRAAIRLLIVFIVMLCCGTNTFAQIHVELLSRTDSFAFLGTGSDNRVRIHNLPEHAVVSMSLGAAVHVRGDEYVLCRFGSCVEKNTVTRLQVKVDGKVVFEKEFKLLLTPVSGSEYNPVLHLKIGARAAGAQGKSDTLTMTKEEFYNAMSAGDLSIYNDTSVKIIGLDVSSQRKGCDYMGPYRIGMPYFACGTLLDADALPRQTDEERMKEQCKTRMLQLVGAPPVRVFMECVKARGKDGSLYTLPSTVIAVQ